MCSCWRTPNLHNNKLGVRAAVRPPNFYLIIVVGRAGLSALIGEKQRAERSVTAAERGVWGERALPKRLSPL